MVFKVRGILEFSPKDKTKKHVSQASWKRVAMIRTDCELDRYYAWFLKKRFNLELNKNIRGTHITFISDKMDRDTFDQASKIFNGKEIDFFMEIEPRANKNGHWWLRVHCPESEAIREAMGLTRDPYFPLHLTIGYANEKNIKHSEYILEQCKVFNLISNDTRRPLIEHDIIEF